ncbi:putative prolyl 4-hydroxylase 9 [Turnera subulata]|uniref:procollagen-proline 4-dioxygenase n=1 Tax=Turnera subulata TaxID=218843 RepID=A0A9Q0F844_9ROSI|nr:putative prolyl 4-hydroxylase 9 [Turnera subulata]
MKSKGSKGGRHWSLRGRLGLPAVILSCSFFFVAGFFSANLLSQNINIPKAGVTARQLQSVEEEGETVQLNLLTPGFTGDDFISVIPFQFLSWRPRALYFPKFATAEQCESIINLSKPHLRPSTVALRKGETRESTKGIRTSYGVFVSASEDKSEALDQIEEKIAKVTRLPRENGEPFNVLRYETGEKYDPHYDAFKASEFGPQKSTRVASFLLYLSDVEEGGETTFPYEDGFDYVRGHDSRPCNGFKIRPRQGDGLLFYSLFPNNTIDPTSLHGSCPVIRGEKWVATKWIRDQEYP